MDTDGKNVTLFLAKLESLRSGLYFDLRNLFIKNGVSNVVINVLQFCSSPCGHGVYGHHTTFNGGLLTNMSVFPRSMQPTIVFNLSIKWDDNRWLVAAEIESETGEETQTIKSFPDRYATTLQECLHAIDLAANDLRSYSPQIIAHHL